MVERRRQGLCYNCDEPYVRGHQCQRLFFLEVSDYTSDGEDDAAAGDADAHASRGGRLGGLLARHRRHPH